MRLRLSEQQALLEPGRRRPAVPGAVDQRRYRAREAEIERLVREAWRERWVVTVVEEHRDHGDRDTPWATRIILRRTGT